MTHEDIIPKIDILKLLDNLEIQGKIQGREFIACCPFPEHDDSSPSFSLAIEGDSIGLWQCFGCNSKGNIIHLVQRCLNVDRETAIKRIGEWFGFSDTIISPSIQEILTLLDKKKAYEVEEDLIRIPLPKVNSDKERIIEYLMTKRKYTEKQAWSILNFYNIAWIDSGYYKDRIIIPIYDSLGSLVTFEASDLTGHSEPKKLYPKGSPISKLLFNSHNVTGDYAWIVEGIWDAIRLWSFGEPVIATFGAHLSSFQARQIIKKYSDVMILFDGDEAGQSAKDKASEVLKPYVNVIEANLRFGDPAELTREEFRELVTFLNIRR